MPNPRQRRDKIAIFKGGLQKIIALKIQLPTCYTPLLKKIRTEFFSKCQAGAAVKPKFCSEGKVAANECNKMADEREKSILQVFGKANQQPLKIRKTWITTLQN